MYQKDVAIIGMSGMFADAANIDEFYRNLTDGNDSVRELTEERLRLTGLNLHQDYQKNGFLPRIDEFDYSFFQLSKSEAENMDPHQRLLLQLVCHAIEHAGYSLRELKGSNTAVILGAPGAPKPTYFQKIKNFDPTVLSGNLYSVLAGRISHAFDLRGPAMIMDTACSSSLLAIHEACQKVRLGEVDYAITGAVSLFLGFPPRFPGEQAVGIESPDGKCKAFDGEADGIVGGEGGGIVILKALEKAINDKDNILAVIKGGAVNQDGARSTSITAPSPSAQTEVLVRAWKQSDIDPATISYIEAHGTGTKLGDPIEIKGLTDAFAQFTDERGICAIGSLKTNIGHLACAAGIASLMKVVLQLQNRKLFPSLHFHTSNPFIDFARSAVYVNNRLQDWEPRSGKRRAGISSFGLSGTNVHLVVEEAPAMTRSETNADIEHEDFLFTVSAKTPTALSQRAQDLLAVLEKGQDEAELANISYVLNQGRDDYAYRFACVANNRDDLKKSIRDASKSFPTSSAIRPDAQVVLVFSHESEYNPDQMSRLCERYPIVRKAWTTCMEVWKDAPLNDAVRRFMLQYALYQQWKAYGIRAVKMLGSGVGHLVSNVVAGKLSLEAGLKQASGLTAVKLPDESKLLAFIQQTNPNGRLLFVEMGNLGNVSSLLSRIVSDRERTVVCSVLQREDAASLNPLLAWLYNNGITIDWTQYYSGVRYARIVLPTYPFENVRCWTEEVTDGSEAAIETLPTRSSAEKVERIPTESPSYVVEANATPEERRLAVFWCEVLKLDHISAEADFFELGGNSLNGLRVINRIKKEFGVDMDFSDVYNFPTIRQLADFLQSLMSQRSEEADSAEVKQDVALVPTSAEPILSCAQQSLWFLDQFEEGDSVYNVPFALRMNGALQVDVLRNVLDEIVNRHAALRSYFPEKAGEPSVAIRSRLDNYYTFVDFSNADASLKETELRAYLNQNAQARFDLETGPIMRAILIRLDHREHVLFVVMHHIVSDGWSLQIFGRELITLYNAFSTKQPSPLAELPVQYNDYAHWQRQMLQGERLEQLTAYWITKLHGAAYELNLPLDRTRPVVQTFEGHSYHFSLSSVVTQRLREVARTEEATLYMFLLAAWKTLLYRISGQEDIVIGSPIAGRNLETENVIGLFINTLVIRSDLSGNPTFSGLIQQVKESVMEAFSYQELPFHKLIELLKVPRTSNWNPLVQVLFDYHNHKTLSSGIEIPNMRIESVPVETERSKFDLCLTMAEGDDTILGLLEYNSTIFTASTIERLMSMYFRLIDCVLSDPQLALLDIELDDMQRVTSPVSASESDTFSFE